MGIAIHFRATTAVVHVDKAVRLGLYSRDAEVVRYNKKVAGAETWLVLFADDAATQIVAQFKAAEVSGFRVYGSNDEVERLYSRASSILDGFTSVDGGLPALGIKKI